MITVDLLQKWKLDLRHVLRPILAVGDKGQRPWGRERRDHRIAYEMIRAPVKGQATLAGAAAEKIRRHHHHRHAYRDARIERGEKKSLGSTAGFSTYGEA